MNHYPSPIILMNVVVGAPRANTSQPGVIEAGAVYLCPWKPNGGTCIPIEFDTEVRKLGVITMKTFKSKQWFGATVNTWKQSIMACAPLQHWNAMDNKEEATKTPVGSCFLATGDRQNFSEYSPCRQIHMHSAYKSGLSGKYCMHMVRKRGRWASSHYIKCVSSQDGFNFTSFLLQVASYFGHTVAVADINGDGKDDILVGAPLFMERRSDGKLYEVGRVYVYLQRRSPRPYRTPWQKLTGTDIYGRFGMAIASLGDIDQDGYIDIAIGAPFAGQDGGGQVYIYRGHSEGLSASPSQILKNPFSESAGFGFAIRGASDIDLNGYPDVLVGAFRTNKVALQLDHMKQKFGRRIFLQETNQPSQLFQMKLSQKIPLTCKNVTAYLRDQADFKDKLSAIVVSLNFSLASSSRAGILQPILSGQLMVQEQTRIILDCGEDNICIPDLKLSAHTNEAFLLIGAENVVLIQITATNAGEGAYEAELIVELPFGAYFQRANSSKLSCNFRKENETKLVACEVGNPMKSHTEIKLDLELSISQLEDANSSIVFVLQLKSKNTLNPNSNIERLQVPLKVDAQVELFGISIPAATVVSWTLEDFKNKSNEVYEYGPKIEHIYRLHNAGPSTVSGADLHVYFPSHFWKGFLLYITRVSTEGNIICSSTNETNPPKVGLSGGTTGNKDLLHNVRTSHLFLNFILCIYFRYLKLLRKVKILCFLMQNH
uniref:Integrin subunit alpha 2b n=1 Tax=Pseudonaja textilis TaxID=8673 RepID=A0A670YQI1_PSETE